MHSPVKPKLPRKPEGLTLQETREKQRILQEKGKLAPQFKYVQQNGTIIIDFMNTGLLQILKLVYNVCSK